MPRRGEFDTVDGMLESGTIRGLKALRQLMTLGSASDKKTPRPLKPSEAASYAKIRLDAAKFFLGLRFGSKARGPMTPDQEARAREDLDAFLKLPVAQRELELQQQVANGSMTEAEAEEIRKSPTYYAAKKVLNAQEANQSEAAASGSPPEADDA